MLHFLKDWWKFTQIHQNYMALRCEHLYMTLCNVLCKTLAVLQCINSLYDLNTKCPTYTGADPGFSFRGGGGRKKIMCGHAHREREARSRLYGRGQGLV